MRKFLVGLVLALLLLFLLSIRNACHAGETWHGPGCDTLGVRLRACSYVEPLVPSPAYYWVSHRPDLVWVSYALLNDEPIEWPAGRCPVLYPGPIYPAVGFAVTPDFRTAPLAHLIPSEMLRARFPCCRELAAIIFVGYPRGTWQADSMTALRLEPLP